MVADSLYNTPMIYTTPLGNTVTQSVYEDMRDTFLVECQSLVNEHMRKYHWDSILTISKGRRYDKIVSTDDQPMGGQRVWGFIDKNNGNILKAESWRKPAKHSRGNIYESDRMQFMSVYGPAYMDTIKSYYGA